MTIATREELEVGIATEAWLEAVRDAHRLYPHVKLPEVGELVMAIMPEDLMDEDEGQRWLAAITGLVIGVLMADQNYEQLAEETVH